MVTFRNQHTDVQAARKQSVTFVGNGVCSLYVTEASCLKKKKIKSFFFFATILSQWDFSYGKFGLLSPVKASCEEWRYPTYAACGVFECFQNPPNSDMDHRIFIVHTDVNACDCTRGYYDTVRESALKVKYS